MKRGLLLSAGMDSTAIAYWHRPEVAFTVNYGQRPWEGELRASMAVASSLDIEHHLITLDASALGAGHLAGGPPSVLSPVPEWWPFRNQLLLTATAMKAVSIGVGHLLLGTVRSDRVHADGTSEFVAAADRLLRLQEGGLSVEAPAIELHTVELLKRSSIPAEILGWTFPTLPAAHVAAVRRACDR